MQSHRKQSRIFIPDSVLALGSICFYSSIHGILCYSLPFFFVARCINKISAHNSMHAICSNMESFMRVCEHQCSLIKLVTIVQDYYDGTESPKTLRLSITMMRNMRCIRCSAVGCRSRNFSNSKNEHIYIFLSHRAQQLIAFRFYSFIHGTDEAEPEWKHMY